MTIDIVVDGQYGSSGKGAVAGYLVDADNYATLIRVAGPNAGHTTYDRKGVPFALRQIPAAGVRDLKARLHIGPGSEVDLDVLYDEIRLLDEAGYNASGRLTVSPEATWLTEEHHRAERALGFGRGGSTFKGVGAARAARAMREAPRICDVPDPGFEVQEMSTVDWSSGRHMIEGTQGYWLGLHAGNYPNSTSSDCRAIDFMAMAGAQMVREVNVFVVFRTFPIRIAGASGDLRGETSWEQLAEQYGDHIQPEKTTVTKKVRRVGAWDTSLIGPAMDANWVTKPARAILTFFDYIHPECTGQQRMPSDLWQEARSMFDLDDSDEGFSRHYGQYLVGVATGPNSIAWG